MERQGNLMRSLKLSSLGAIIFLYLISASAWASNLNHFRNMITTSQQPNVPILQQTFTVTKCSNNYVPPFPFKIDCSELTDPISKANCPLYIQDVACNVYPIYQNLTGGALDKFCPVVTYHIIPSLIPTSVAAVDTWGGMSHGSSCSIDYHEGLSVNPGAPAPPPGPNAGKPPPEAYGSFGRDIHEILHQIHYSIDPAIDTHDHPFFGTSQTEVRRQLGMSSNDALSQTEGDYQQYSDNPANCPQAEGAVEDSLYIGWLKFGLVANNVVKEIYSRLRADPAVVLLHAPIDDAAIGVDPVKALKGGDGNEVDRVLVEMTGENFKTFSGQIVKTKEYLIQHGCPAF